MTSKRFAGLNTLGFGFAEDQQQTGKASEWAVGLSEAVGWGADGGHVTS
jgi:hypothetical protein